MYTAKLLKKTQDGGAKRFHVEFTDGTNTFIESVVPQDGSGFKFWVKSRLAVFNNSEALAGTLADNSVVDTSDPVVVPPTPTQAELDRQEWLINYQKWVKVKATLIDTGILTGNETQVTNLKTKVQDDFKASYLDSI